MFLAPESMRAAFDARLPHPPKCTAGYFRCAYRSLAQGYRQAIEEIERNTGRTYDRLYIVGGGARNQYLNRLTEEATGKQVIALPIEATAIGNLKIQMTKRLQGESLTTASGGYFVRDELNRNKRASQCEVAPIEVAEAIGESSAERSKSC